MVSDSNQAVVLGNMEDNNALIAERESEKIWMCSGVDSKE